MKKFSSECPVWGPRDTHGFHDEDDGHEMAACECGAPNPNIAPEPSPALGPDDNPPW